MAFTGRTEEGVLMAHNAPVQSVEAHPGSAARVHRAISSDGTEIAGYVIGQGPPLVLVHAGLGDGTLDWAFALPVLRERFTCYCMSMRGRGLSSENSDLSFQRCVDDVVAFAGSVGEPVGLAGPSGGALFVLGAAAASPAIAAAAVCDPIAFDVLSEEDQARFHDAVERMARLAAEGRLAEAARDWMTEWATDREMETLSESGYLAACSRYVPVLLRALHQAEEDTYSPTDPSLLSQITVPVVILQGSDAESVWPWFTRSVRHIADHVADAHVYTVHGAGHMGAWVKPEAYADELARFFEARLRPT
jgi:pimeloyl-ACP methyl ester carboxylesterase